jgi:hypothetical protein
VSAPAQRCDQLYATHGLGTGLTVSGALLLAGGTVLLAIPGRPRAPSVAQLLLGRSGPAATRVSATSR